MILIGQQKWEAKIKEIESKKTEVLKPILSEMPPEKRIEYCHMMIDNIKNDESNHLNFGGGKR